MESSFAHSSIKSRFGTEPYVPEVLSIARLLLNHVLVAHGPTPAAPVAAADPAVRVVPLGRDSAEDDSCEYLVFRLETVYVFQRLNI